ncbi:hypothetical protein CYMTET_34970, partial [Cymbomonas tetramitiformis]
GGFGGRAADVAECRVRWCQEGLAARQAAAASASEGGAPDGLKMEGPEVLQFPGSSDGETKVVREGNTGMVYSWNAGTGAWEKLGEVVGAPENSVAVEGRMLHGVQYDYVFDVDIEDGVPPRKLPFNRDQNPHTVAANWLEQEGLPASYREQVVDFILQNTGGAAALPSMMPANTDPFTGAGSYMPAPASNNVGMATNPDPFTGLPTLQERHMKHRPHER